MLTIEEKNILLTPQYFLLFGETANKVKLYRVSQLDRCLLINFLICFILIEF